MKTTMPVDINFFVEIAPKIQWGENLLSDTKEALATFVGSYAFEHAGRNPNYGPTASKVVQDTELNNLRPDVVWNSFMEKMEGAALNESLNPLAHNTQCNPKKRCVLCAITNGKTIFNIIQKVKSDVEQNRVLEAHNFLKSIRGVRDKIASLFMRDVTMSFNLSPSHYRVLLQPIDVWVKRIANFLATGQYDSAPVTSDLALATWIVCYSGTENPERANFGMWHFGANIIRRGNADMLEQALGDRSVAERLWHSSQQQNLE